MTRLVKPVTRTVDVFLRVGARREHDRALVVRITPEGVYLKRERQRWSSAYLLPWSAAFVEAGKLRAVQLRRERAERRRLKKAGA